MWNKSFAFDCMIQKLCTDTYICNSFFCWQIRAMLCSSDHLGNHLPAPIANCSLAVGCPECWIISTLNYRIHLRISPFIVLDRLVSRTTSTTGLRHIVRKIVLNYTLGGVSISANSSPRPSLLVFQVFSQRKICYLEKKIWVSTTHTQYTTTYSYEILISCFSFANNIMKVLFFSQFTSVDRRL